MWEEAGFVDCTKYWMPSDCKPRPRSHTINNHLVEGENIEPGALIAGRIQRHSHGILLQKGRQPLVNGEILVRLDVQQLNHISVLGGGRVREESLN